MILKNVDVKTSMSGLLYRRFDYIDVIDIDVINIDVVKYRRFEHRCFEHRCIDLASKHP